MDAKSFGFEIKRMDPSGAGGNEIAEGNSANVS